MKQINLYLINNSDSAITYGIGAYLKELSNALKGTDVNVHIVYLHSARKKFEIEKSDDPALNSVENWYVPEVRYENSAMSNSQKIDAYCRNVLYLLRLYIKNDDNELIFHFNNNYCKQLAKDVKSAFNCRTVVALHYSTWMLELQGNMQRLHKINSKPENERKPFELRMYESYEYENALFKEVDHVIALSQHMQLVLETEFQLDSDKISVIPNGLKDSGATPFSGKHALRKKWKISAGEKIILFAGRMNENKGLSYLIKAFRNVLLAFPESRLIIAGDGNFSNFFKASQDICTKITFTGFLENKALHELYQIADVGVVPSFFETFGYVAVEMMMHGLPLVVTATSGLNEVVDESCGLKIPILEYADRVEIDTDLLAEKIVYLLEHPKEAKQLGNNARKRYEKLY